jgi:peptidoglycan hydrolase-like protein with peptidoglycan-binding domain
MSELWTANTATPVTVDGGIGPQTIKALQYGLGLPADGVLGAQTAGALQAALGVTVDGDIGPETTKALQTALGITVDGGWGPQTTTALQTALNAGTLATKLHNPNTIDVSTLPAPSAPVTPSAPAGSSSGGAVDSSGAISLSQVDYSGAGSWGSGQSACQGYIEEALAVLGIVDNNGYWVNGMLTIASRESDYNSSEYQVNLTDSNAVGATQSDGAPLQSSRGGWQCIPQTFSANHASGTSDKIYDPVANCAAAMNYVMRDYGVSRDGSDLASKVQQADPNRSPMGY